MPCIGVLCAKNGGQRPPMPLPKGERWNKLRCLAQLKPLCACGLVARPSGALGAEQPATWVTVLTGDMGNTFPVLFRSAVVVGPVDPVGNASSRCPQVHRPFALVCAGGRHHAR